MFGVGLHKTKWIITLTNNCAVYKRCVFFSSKRYCIKPQSCNYMHRLEHAMRCKLVYYNSDLHYIYRNALQRHILDKAGLSYHIGLIVLYTLIHFKLPVEQVSILGKDPLRFAIIRPIFMLRCSRDDPKTGQPTRL